LTERKTFLWEVTRQCNHVQQMQRWFHFYKI
jgi:hypothetical protein